MVVPRKELSYNETVEFVTQRLQSVYLHNHFYCEVCGRNIPPHIYLMDGEVLFHSARGELSGGKGNKVLKKNVCEDCLKQINLGLKLNNSEVEL